MTPPFRLNKKARRRQRKLVKSLADEKALAKWDEVSANTFRRIAESTMKQANAKRRRKDLKNQSSSDRLLATLDFFFADCPNRGRMCQPKPADYNRNYQN